MCWKNHEKLDEMEIIGITRHSQVIPIALRFFRYLFIDLIWLFSGKTISITLNCQVIPLKISTGNK